MLFSNETFNAPVLTAAVSVQILTTRQQARCVVNAFPYSPDKLRILEVLAAARQEPPVSLLTQQGDGDDWQHYANWQQVVHLLQTVTKANLHLHVPVSRL